MVKVSGFISEESHADLLALASRFHSTVKAVASWAIESAIEELSGRDKLPKGLETDKRRDRTKNGKD